ncbi:MAG: hypothetical protein P4L83_21150 [Nevskia sp.]|nr:hypothetical protein [Nevskia sp.]
MPKWIKALQRRALWAPEDGGAGGAGAGAGAGAGSLLGGAAAGAAAGGGAGGGAGGAERGWLPDEYRADPAFKDLADVGALAKSYRHAVSLVGADRAELLQMPKDGPDDKWDGWARLGRPEKPEGYQIDKPPEGVPETAMATFRQRMHAAGASQKQVGEALAVYSDVAAAQQAELDKVGLTADRQKALFGAVLPQEKALTQLKGEWGAAYDAKLAGAVRAVRELGGGDLITLLDATGLGNHPLILNAFAKAGERMAEPAGLKGGSGGQMQGPLTPELAKAEIQKLSGDTAFFAKMGNAQHPEHKQAMERWNELHRYAYGAAA